MKLTDELTRNLRRNIFINKIKEVSTFIQLIESIFKTIIGKSDLVNFFYRFDRSLSIDVEKKNDIFDFIIHLRNIKSGPQMFIEDLYALLYMFFVTFEVLSVNTVSERDGQYDVTLSIKFSISDAHNVLLKETLLKIKQLKNMLNQMRIKNQKNREESSKHNSLEDIFITN